MSVTIKLKFDRKGVADNKTHKALVQVHVIYKRKSYFISTGIKLFKKQWNSETSKVCNDISADAKNKVLSAFMEKCESYNADCIARGVEFDIETLKNRLSGGVSDSFIDFVIDRIENRGDISQTTRNMQMSVMNIVKEYGKLNTFADLTVENITKFDDYLRNERKLMDTSVYSKHKVLKHYITDAVNFDIIAKSPYNIFKPKRGKARKGRYLEEYEIELIEKTSIPPNLEKIRLLMLLQIYTGLAYQDLFAFDRKSIVEVDGHKVYIIRRGKSKEISYIVLLPQALDVLDKLGDIKKMSNQEYNEYMRMVGMMVGLDITDLSSHCLRRTCGTYLLNIGVEEKSVSHILGHKTVQQTRDAYAFLKARTIIKDMEKALKK